MSKRFKWEDKLGSAPPDAAPDPDFGRITDTPVIPAPDRDPPEVRRLRKETKAAQEKTRAMRRKTK